MKRTIVIALVVLALLISTLACSSGSSSYTPPRTSETRHGGYTKSECKIVWEYAEVEPDMESWFVSMVLNKNHPPDSIGAVIKDCINGGWEGWR